MDAVWTRACLSLLLVSLIGCQQKSPRVASTTLNGQNCDSMASQTSFLVSWKGEVPAQFQNLKINDQSNITRFKNTTKQELEEITLKGFNGNDLYAEHEFIISVEQSSSQSVRASAPTAYGIDLIRAKDAWAALNTRGAGVIVAVIDSGVDINHPLLKPRIWSNPGESGSKATNGQDDDGNGLIDDAYGWNFYAKNNDLTDGIRPHGTHVAGIVAGQPGRYGFIGSAPDATLMPLKFMDSTGVGNIGDAISAIEYAVAKSARVINASWGGGSCSQLLKEKIAWATSSGSVFLAAAGNNTVDINKSPKWPAAFIVPGKLTIGAIGPSEVMSTYSNYGVLVDVAAPGDDILSTVPVTFGGVADPLEELSGTSMATPFVAGIAAMLLSAKPNSSPEVITNAIVAGIVKKSQIVVKHQGRVDALNSANFILSQ